MRHFGHCWGYDGGAGRYTAILNCTGVPCRKRDGRHRRGGGRANSHVGFRTASACYSQEGSFSFECALTPSLQRSFLDLHRVALFLVPTPDTWTHREYKISCCVALRCVELSSPCLFWLQSFQTQPSSTTTVVRSAEALCLPNRFSFHSSQRMWANISALLLPRPFA